MESDGLDRWVRALRKVGLDGNEYAYKITAGDESASMFQARYMAKWGRVASGDWSIEHELTKSISKRASGGNMAPLDLLINAAAGDQGAARWFVEYAHAFKGKKHLRFKRGTPDLLGIRVRSDEELANYRGAGELVGLISAPEWIRHGYGQARVDILQAAAGAAGVIGELSIIQEVAS
jgi:hypothetical protein